jgi:UV excision repair protein RAD23
MKLILKNLKQVQFNVELESDKKTIQDLKNEIEKVHGFDAAQLKLLHNGRILDNAKTLEEYQIKDENVIIMMNTKPKQKEQPPSTEPPKTEPEKKEETEKKEEPPKQPEPQPQSSNSEYANQINSLVEMGYEKEKVEKAINAAKGNLDLALEFLGSGNIPDSAPQTQSQPQNQSQQSQGNRNLSLELRRNASLIKIICKDNPEKVFNILNNLKQRNPALLEKIKEHEQDFKNLLVSPISQEDIDNFKAVEQNLQGLLGEGGRRPGQVEIRLTPEEAEAVKRLKELGDFSQAEVIQAFFARDKNEELTANYLFEQKMRDDEEEANNQNNNNNQGQ